MGIWLGLDLGGTNTKVVIVDDDGWTVREQESEPTDRRSPALAIAGCAKLAERWARRMADVRGVGVTIPGLFDHATGCAVIVPNIPGTWRGMPVREPIQAATGRPTTLINDARAFGLAETRLGAARHHDDVLGVVLGTGVGGAVVLGGRIFPGHTGNAGEIGHQVLLPDGPPCGCGNHGCLESLVRADVVAAAAGCRTVAEATRAAEAGDQRAHSALTEAGRWTGRGLANLVTVLTPQAVVVGGGLAGAGQTLLTALRRQLAASSPLVPPHSYEVVTAALGSFAGAVGAAVAAYDAVTDAGPRTA